MFVCINCINDEYIKSEIVEKNTRQKCSYCNEIELVIDIEELASWVDSVFRENYKLGEEYPVFYGESDNPHWETKGELPIYVLTEMMETSEEVATDVFKILESLEWGHIRDGGIPFYDETNNYEEIETSDYEHRESWNDFKRIIKHSTRYFSSTINELLDELFKDIEKYPYRGEQSPIRALNGKDEDIIYYRARKVNSSEERIKVLENPHSELGPPPNKIAPDGRMNARGIPVFYCSTDESTCLSEIRPVVGEIVITGQFKLIGELKVLDLTLLRNIYDRLSYFDSQFKSKISKIAFLRNFDLEICQPILPGQESLEYISTQALVEYIFYQYKENIGAILYSSSQTNGKGKNIVIKKEACGILKSEKEKNQKVITEEYYHYENWDEMGYLYFKGKRDPKRKDYSQLFDSFELEDYDIFTEPNFKLIVDKLRIHECISIANEYKSCDIRVSKHENDRNIDF